MRMINTRQMRAIIKSSDTRYIDFIANTWYFDIVQHLISKIDINICARGIDQ